MIRKKLTWKKMTWKHSQKLNSSLKNKFTWNIIFEVGNRVTKLEISLITWKLKTSELCFKLVIIMFRNEY